MNRLWKVAMAFGLAGAVAMTDALRFGNSMWPAVVLLCAGAVVACIAAAVDSAEVRENEEQAEDVHDALSLHREQMAKDIAAIAKVVNDHAADIDHLKKRGVYGDTLGG